MTQGIYRVDPDLYPLLIDTSLGADLPVEPLRRLPEWCVYVETQGIPVAGHNCVGAFCRVDPGSGGSEWLKIGLDTDTGGFLPVDLPLRGTLQSCMDEAVASGALCEQDARTCIQACAPIINLLLYVCECADISGAHGRPANPAPVRTRRGGVKLFPASSPKMWDVGVRMGAALRAAYAATAGAQGGHTGASVRGHIRRAHWHGFYSGPKKTPDGAVIPADKRRFGLRWMPPIAVNLPDVDGLPATIRRVS